MNYFDVFADHADNLESLIGGDVLTQNPDLGVHKVESGDSVLQLSLLTLEVVDHVSKFALQRAQLLLLLQLSPQLLCPFLLFVFRTPFLVTQQLSPFLLLLPLSTQYLIYLKPTLSCSAFFWDSSACLRAFRFWFRNVLGRISVITDLYRESSSYISLLLISYNILNFIYFYF